MVEATYRPHRRPKIIKIINLVKNEILNVQGNDGFGENGIGKVYNPLCGEEVKLF